MPWKIFWPTKNFSGHSGQTIWPPQTPKILPPYSQKKFAVVVEAHRSAQSDLVYLKVTSSEDDEPSTHSYGSH